MTPTSVVAWVKLAIVTSLVGFSMSLYVLYALFWPHDPFNMGPNDFTLVKPRFQRGEVVLTRAKFCKYGDEPAVNNFAIDLGDQVLPLINDVRIASPAGCRTIVLPIVPVPKNLPLQYTTAEGEGMGRILAHVCYKVSPLRDKCYDFSTPWFQIDP